MTINAQRQPTLIRINKMHVNCGRRVPVLLAPWSLKGTLLPLTEKANMKMDEHNEYKEWNKFIPLEISQLEGDLQTDEDMPRMVAVEIDSIRMFYPSCLICVTLDEDGHCHSVNNPNDILPNLTPSELIVQETHAPLSMNSMSSQVLPPRIVISKRNKLLTAGGEALWSSKGLAQVTRYTVNQQNSIRRPYHERTKKNKKSESGINRTEPMPSSLESDCMSDEEKEPVVDWATCQTGDLQTGMYCSADEAMVYHYDPNNQTLPLTDDETFVCSPFTPVRTISPCVNCTWPAAPASQMVSSVFNEIFWENDDTQQLPSHTSLERKAAAADYYYNPTLPSLWEQPHYATYHNRRQNEKRRANYPPAIRFDELSPEEPGSQETIPATTSPLPEDDARRTVGREPSLLMDSIRNVTGNAKRAAASGAPEAKRRRIVKKKKKRMDNKELNWPSIEDLDIEDISHDTEEDFFCKVHFDTGRDSPDSEHSEPASPVVEEPPQNADCEEDIDDGGEGCSSISGGDMIVPMDVDEAPASTQPADSILSPPASNETPEQGNHHWNRVGTPSVGENTNYTSWQPRLAQADAHSMNQIYPTPPSVQSEAQQFSPASVPPPQQTMAHMPPCSQLYQTENDEVTEPVELVNAQEEEELSEEELPLLPINDPIKFFIDKKGPIAGILQKIERRPIHGVRENVRLPIVTRFSSKYRLSGKGAAVLPQPLDYQKMISRSEKNNSPNVQPTEHQRFFDESITVTFPDERMPGTPTQLQAMAMQYNFRPPYMTQLSTTMAPPTPQSIHPHHPGLPPNHPMQSQFMHPQMQMRMGPMGAQTPPHAAFGPPHGYMHNQGIQGMYAMQLGAGNQMSHYGGMQAPQNLNSQMQPPLYSSSSVPMRSTGFHQNGPMAPPYARQPSIIDLTGPMSGASTSNAPFQNINQHQQTTPQFPVSHHTPQTMHMVPSSSMHQRRELVPEGSSIVLALVLSDTILDLHFDTVFDACPICSCHTSIRARELGMYITPPEILRQPADQQLIGPWSGFAQQEASTPCTCGFSAVRHRYLSVCSGLFPEDAREATALDSAALSHVPSIQLDSAALVPATNISWFNPENDVHLNIVNQIRILSQTHNWGKAIHHLGSLTEQMSKALKPQEAISSDTGGNADYIVSLVDQTELLLLGNAAMELVTINMLGNRRNTNPSPNFLTYFHPWGLQIANEIREPSVSEWKYLLDNILNSVDKSMKAVRCAGSQEMGKIVEGPLTWRQFVTKNQKTTKDGAAEDELFMQEPIPYILASTDKDAIRIAPQAVQMWENLSLGPYDQPKDVLYVAVTVDCKEAVDSTKTYLENISQLYERMRLGRHVACPTGECRDGVLKSVSNPTKNKFTASPQTIDFQDMAKYVDNKNFMIKLKNFVQSMEESLAQLLIEEERLFDRGYFRELLALDWRAKRNASAALAANAEKKYYERENQKPEEMGTSSHQPPTPLQPQLNLAPQLTPAGEEKTDTLN
ncbi:hypothetical protein WR25_14684 isoform Q [Diploscapter pachys]|uniref:Mediator of RNA polymerase II transcription subunit 13 n=1 Tax=Diploscapter pachys TaxID=2018661 RepID=A0A2A2JH18_9BILA|nr:hypothetical protein WR25_14684 isoform A [Diploscapter pachys]PAV60827.1 hypothetical protein WR25_14684 isoform G [Diploscapter pachys]PAV60828.1 hypothetical protein WR25_14684 isoform H [Diploscapter pachys]PAV60829.1 hypothetical protein WR25_14684 isoform I [Diploscapter pachys]PAV60832.1 hypothetical protein WR25_14684 isoform L [Diploscapter pachys]